MSDVKITNYLPEISEISTATLVDARDRIKTYLSAEFGDTVDMAPNSVFGDLVLNPIAHLVAGFEIAANRLFSDIDLTNVAEGTVYNCEFVQKYLENFGLSQRLEFPSTGVIRLTFTKPGSYTLDARSSILFTLNNVDYVFKFSEVDDFITIASSIEGEEETASKRKLIKINENEYVVNMPVTGPAGVAILKSTEGSSNISIANLKSVKSVIDFDPGVLPENVMELANKAQTTYYASSLTNRTGCLSFLLQTFPELQGVSPVLSGDSEMARGTTNILGVSEGVMDIHVKSRKTFVTEFLTQRLAYSNTLGRWQGTLTSRSGPPVQIQNITRTGGGSVTYDVYGKSSDSYVYPNLSASYSLEEILAVSSSAASNASDVDSSIDFTQQSDPTNVGIVITGEYEGYIFSSSYSRTVNLNLKAYDIGLDIITADLTDIKTNETVEVEFIETVNATKIYTLQESAVYNKFLKGIDINIEFLLATPIEDQITTMLDQSELFTAIAKNSEFTVEYEYDPNLVNINTLVNNVDVRPVNTSLLVRNFLTCKVDNVDITYRSKIGKTVDTTNATAEIIKYVNSLSYPNLYEEHAVAEIVLYYGADGIRKVEQQGQFFRTQANKYLVTCASNDNDSDGENCYEDVLNPTTTTLLPSDNMVGLGERNIHYLLKSEDITFNEISF
jgi:hypothetical protein